MPRGGVFPEDGASDHGDLDTGLRFPEDSLTRGLELRVPTDTCSGRIRSRSVLAGGTVTQATRWVAWKPVEDFTRLRLPHEKTNQRLLKLVFAQVRPAGLESGNVKRSPLVCFYSPQIIWLIEYLSENRREEEMWRKCRNGFVNMYSSEC